MSQAFGNVPGKCPSRKIPYHSIDMAHRAIKSIKDCGDKNRRRNQGRLNAYWCETCSAFHVGHRPKYGRGV